MRTPRLEPEQGELLRRMAEIQRQTPRDQRGFMLISTMQADLLMGGDTQFEVIADDVHQLVHAGLLRVSQRGRKGTLTVVVTPEGFDFLEDSATSEPIARVEEEVHRYLDSDGFRAAYGVAYQRWSEAAELLWGGDADRELTTIGHKTREAVQEFAAALVERNQVRDAPANPAHTVGRLKSVIVAHRARLGEAREHLLDALVAYWGEVNDLLQRQEHGGQKEGEPLTWDDGRRAVFQTALVMYEIDRTLG